MQCTAKTASGKRCKLTAADDALMCPIHLGRAKVGRPTVLNEAVTIKIETVLSQGGYVSTAARVAGIATQQFYTWLQRGKSDAEADAPYRAFRERIEQAQAQGEARLVLLISQKGASDWRAAAWMLERQYPERWGPRDQRQAPAAPGDPFSEVDEIAARRSRRPASS